MTTEEPGALSQPDEQQRLEPPDVLAPVAAADLAPEPGDPADRLTPDEVEDFVAAEPTPAPITFTGQDFDVSGLVQRLQRDDILIPSFGHQDGRIEAAGYQRAFVWKKAQMDKFVESILLGYPVPGIFLVRQTDKRYLVLDGQQRLRTLKHFVEGLYAGREFTLGAVGPVWKGFSYKTLPENARRVFDDAYLSATIILSDGSDATLEAIYQLFERLNSGGTQLTPHEIRVALFAGPLISYLERLNQVPGWRAIYGQSSPRLRDQELVLRILALTPSHNGYARPLKTFLNNFAKAHRNVANIDLDAFADRFGAASDMLLAAGGRQLLRPGGNQLNAALTEAVLVGIVRRLESGTPVDAERFEAALTKLLAEVALDNATTRATADEEAVRTRLTLATDAFAHV